MSMNVRELAGWQRTRPVHSRRQARARENAASTADAIAQRMEQHLFPTRLPGIGPEALNGQKIRPFRRFAAKLRQFARENIGRETAQNLQIAREAAVQLTEAENTMWETIFTAEGQVGKVGKEVPEDSLGFGLREVRIHHGISQGRLAAIGGFTQHQISAFETNKYAPMLPTIARYVLKVGGEFSDADVLNIVRNSLGATEDDYPLKTLRPTPEAVKAEVVRQKAEFSRNGKQLFFGSYMRMLRERIIVPGKRKARSLEIKELAQLWGSNKVALAKLERGEALPMFITLVDWMSSLGLKSNSLEASVAWVLALEEGEKRMNSLNGTN